MVSDNDFDAYEPGSDISPSAEQELNVVKDIFGGYVPTFHRVLANSPASLSAFNQACLALQSGTLDAAERAIVAIEVARHADCHYCTAAHCLMIKNTGIDDASYQALMKGGQLTDGRKAVIQRTTRTLITSQGRLIDAELSQILNRGLTLGDVTEIIAVIGLFTWATTLANLSGIELDEAFTKGDVKTVFP